MAQRTQTGPCAQAESLRESGAVRALSMGDLVASAASQQAQPSVLQGIDGGIHNPRHRPRSIVSDAEVLRVGDDLVDHRAQGFGFARAVELRLAVAVFLAFSAASLSTDFHHVSERVLAAEGPGMG